MHMDVCIVCAVLNVFVRLGTIYGTTTLINPRNTIKHFFQTKEHFYREGNVNEHL